jgi:hypothetical protein
VELIATVIDEGFMVMCSDFSLKALVSTWNLSTLGPNPFALVAEFGASFNIRFEPAVLKRCPSAQLAVVGDLCTDGLATVHAQSGTCACKLLSVIFVMLFSF